MRLWRCQYTREWVVAFGPGPGRMLLGYWIPFLGFKNVGCRATGESDTHTWPPRFTKIAFCVAWLGRGWFFAPSNAKVAWVKDEGDGRGDRR